MTRRAWLYWGIMVIIGALIAGQSFQINAVSIQTSTLFILLTLLATLTQLNKKEAPNHQLYHLTLMFLFAGILVLPFSLFILMVIICHLIEWAKERLLKSAYLRNWYIQPFNIFAHIITGFLTIRFIHFINPNMSNLLSGQAALAALIGAATYVFINHILVGEVLVLARNVSWKESGILNLENILTDFSQVVMGFIIAVLIELNVWLLLPALSQFYLIYRALSVPQLKQQANTDPKTNLWNADYFMKVLDLELKRANRYQRPLTIVMADLDLLRNINNTYGHLAGDIVLAGVADILRQNFRDYDIVARFGGEEFSIMLPETLPENALTRIEDIRKIIEAAEFISPTTEAKIRVTMSFGIAAARPDAMDAKDIIHCADVALYNAKLSGRNRSCIFSDEHNADEISTQISKSTVK